MKNHYYKSSYHLHLNEQNQTINMSTWFSALLHVPTESTVPNIKKELIITYLKLGIIYQMQPFEQCILVCQDVNMKNPKS